MSLPSSDKQTLLSRLGKTCKDFKPGRIVLCCPLAQVKSNLPVSTVPDQIIQLLSNSRSILFRIALRDIARESTSQQHELSIQLYLL